MSAEQETSVTASGSEAPENVRPLSMLGQAELIVVAFCHFSSILCYVLCFALFACLGRT